jgi:hypothetical protein
MLAMGSKTTYRRLLQEAIRTLWLFRRRQLAPPPGFARALTGLAFETRGIAKAPSAIVVAEMLLHCTNSPLLAPTLLAVELPYAFRNVANYLRTTLASMRIAAGTREVRR